jgi:hypothetical protein
MRCGIYLHSQYVIPYAVLSTLTLLAVLSCAAAVAAAAAVVSLLLVKATCALANSMSSSHLNISICSSFSRSSCITTVNAFKQAVNYQCTHVIEVFRARSHLVLVRSNAERCHIATVSVSIAKTRCRC